MNDPSKQIPYLKEPNLDFDHYQRLIFNSSERLANIDSNLDKIDDIFGNFRPLSEEELRNLPMEDRILHLEQHNKIITDHNLKKACMETIDEIDLFLADELKLNLMSSSRKDFRILKDRLTKTIHFIESYVGQKS